MSDVLSPGAPIKIELSGLSGSSTEAKPSVHFSSAKTGGSDSWSTPQWLYQFLDTNFGPFTIDAAADAENAKTPVFFDETTDGLRQVWTGTVWCNPPYSKIADWIKKGFDSVYLDKTAERVVFLIPARTDTSWWHAFVQQGLIFFLKGRLVFVQPEVAIDIAAQAWFARRKRVPTDVELNKKREQIRKQPAPFPSAVVVFDRQLIPAGEDIPALGGVSLRSYAVTWKEQK